MDLKEKIEKQLAAGFTKGEIVKNLLDDGHNEAEIKECWTAENIKAKEDRKVSTKGIILGFVFLLIMVVRIARFSSSGSIFAFIGIITALILAFLYFTKRI